MKLIYSLLSRMQAGALSEAKLAMDVISCAEGLPSIRMAAS